MLYNGDYFIEKLKENEPQKKLERKGIDIKDLFLFKAGNSITFKGIKSKGNKDIFLKIIGKKNINIDFMEKILKKYNDSFPYIFYRPIIEDHIYLFMEEVNVFSNQKEIKLGHLRKILNIIQILAKKKIYYSDIYFDNFGYKEGKTLLVDFTDLFLSDLNELHVHGGYEPPEYENKSVNPVTLSYIFALFTTEILFKNGYETTNKIKHITELLLKQIQNPQDKCLNNLDKFLLPFIRFLLNQDELINKNYSMGNNDKDELINQLSEMFLINPTNRPSICRIKL